MNEVGSDESNEIDLVSEKIGKYLVFTFRDGKNVKYDLSTGQTIGKNGRPVKSIQSQLRGYSLREVIESFKNESYRNYLWFVNRRFINKVYGGCTGSRIRNVGSFLARLWQYSFYEQYFAAGIQVDDSVRIPLSDIPNHLISIVREHNIRIDDQLLLSCLNRPEILENAFGTKYQSIDSTEITPLICRRAFRELLDVYNYNAMPLLAYIDELATYEAINPFSLIDELLDYNVMMSKICKKSDTKYDKYPRKFLTTHRIATRNFERMKKEFDEDAYKAAIDRSLEWTHGKYTVMYPNTTEEIKAEAATQVHCVASYIDKVISGECDILFLRLRAFPDDSLLTLCVENHELTQARGRFNRDPTSAERAVLNEYKKYLSRVCKHAVNVQPILETEVEA